MNANEPLKKRRDNVPPVKTTGLLLPEERVNQLPVYQVSGRRREGVMISIQA